MSQMMRFGEGAGKDDTRVQRRVMTTYNRLVRDRIPAIIEAMGNIAVWQRLEDDAFERALLDATARASHQFAATGSLESLADVLDAVDAWLELTGLSMEEVDRARVERRKRCGAYDDRLFLECVADGDDAEGLVLKERYCE